VRNLGCPVFFLITVIGSAIGCQWGIQYAEHFQGSDVLALPILIGIEICGALAGGSLFLFATGFLFFGSWAVWAVYSHRRVLQLLPPVSGSNLAGADEEETAHNEVSREGQLDSNGRVEELRGRYS
jgi:hypothetical protein